MGEVESDDEIDYFEEYDEPLGEAGRTVLQNAVVRNDKEHVMALIATKDCPIDEVSPQDKRTPLTLSCYLGQSEYVEALLQAGADVNGKPSNAELYAGANYFYHPMRAACYNGHRWTALQYRTCTRVGSRF